MFPSWYSSAAPTRPVQLAGIVGVHVYRGPTHGQRRRSLNETFGAELQFPSGASAYAALMARRAADFGVDVGGRATVDIDVVRRRSEAVVAPRRRGLEEWLGGIQGCTIVRTYARFVSPREIDVDGRNTFTHTSYMDGDLVAANIRDGARARAGMCALDPGHDGDRRPRHLPPLSCAWSSMLTTTASCVRPPGSWRREPVSSTGAAIARGAPPPICGSS
ncbi:hypothetical protein ACVWW4_000341 [Bradyrhizobium sp. LB7.1]